MLGELIGELFGEMIGEMVEDLISREVDEKVGEMIDEKIDELKDIIKNKSDDYKPDAIEMAIQILEDKRVEVVKHKPKIKIEDSTREVHLTGINIPFGEMVEFIFKWTLASIPTALFFGLIIFILSWIIN